MARCYDMSKAISARRIAGGALICPACRRRMEKPAESCPDCGFTGRQTVEMFPYAAPELEPMMDEAGLLGESERRRVLRRIGRLRRRFRQIQVSVCVVDLPEDVCPRLFGFWLLNAAPGDAVDGEAPNAWTVLLVIEVGREAASVSCGYAVEAFVSDDSWLRCLELLGESWQQGDRAGAVLDFLDGAEKELAEAARRVDRLLRKGGRH